MSLLKKVLLILLLFGAISIIFFSWYLMQHSMDEARPLEINTRGLEKHILIASQGSEFKDSVVVSVINQLKDIPVYIKVVDVSQLSTVDEKEWSAIIILHTWENFSPQKDAQKFIDRALAKNKIIVMSTSGGGDSMIQGVDGITSASELRTASAKATEIVHRVKSILNIP